MAVLAGTFDGCDKSYQQDYEDLHRWAAMLLTFADRSSIRSFMLHPRFQDPSWHASDVECMQAVHATVDVQLQGADGEQRYSMQYAEPDQLFPSHRPVSGACAWDGVVEWLPAMLQWRQNKAFNMPMHVWTRESAGSSHTLAALVPARWHWRRCWRFVWARY